MIRVALVDDHILTLKGAKELLKSDEDIQVVYDSSDPLNFQAFLNDNGIDVDIIIVDLNMPHLNGVELTKKFKIIYPNLKIIVLSMIDEANMIQRMLKYGVEGYLVKNNIQNELISAVKEVASGNTYLNKDVERILFRNSQKSIKREKVKTRPRLSSREKEVLALIVQEYTTPEIAEELFISQGTVITHRKHLLSKMNVKNTAGIVRVALEWGLV